jgi:hypothetical protein
MITGPVGEVRNLTRSPSANSVADLTRNCANPDQGRRAEDRSEPRGPRSGMDTGPAVTPPSPAVAAESERPHDRVARGAGSRADNLVTGRLGHSGGGMTTLKTYVEPHCSLTNRFAAGCTRTCSPSNARHPRLERDNPRPFTWTKSAGEILERLAAYLDRIPGAGH